ncbi:MAG: quinone-dependent dihydroorotate dehydrogenase [Bacteroidetes bacterium]|nr:quinone-dependent dihydroorotate dehydrogenase [Bacteroidota bacterium]
MYKTVARPLLFLLPAESAHYLTLNALKLLLRLPFARNIFYMMYADSLNKHSKELLGMKFMNPVGLAAGFDKNARYYKELACLGFGFIEIGTVTPKAQTGNPKPRLFRLKKDEAVLNRMGFNNDGVDMIASRLQSRLLDPITSQLIIGGNIGKNKDTPIEKAVDDYLVCLNKLYDVVDYFVVNVSSPNTPGLRDLQEKEPLLEILKSLKDAISIKPVIKPIFLKIAPDLSNDQLDDVIDVVLQTGIEGIIATNTTVNRSGLSTDPNKVNGLGDGGISGKPLGTRSLEVLKYIKNKSNNKLVVISVGGIHSGANAKERFEQGADLVQVYTGFIYEGPGLVRDILSN